MENNKLLSRIACILLCLLSVDCAVTHEPQRWLPEPEEVPLDPYGSWAEVTTKGSRVMGELIAVTSDTVFVADTMLHGVPVKTIERARVVTFEPDNYIASVLWGPLLTISNGFFLILTAPMWIIGGPIATIARSYDPIVDYPSKPLTELQCYARFPQGLPHDIDRSAIQMKQVRRKWKR